MALSTAYRMLARQAGASSLPIPITPKGTHNAGRPGKKRPNALAEIRATFLVSQPLRLMYQDEARFGRISDTRYGWAKKPLRPWVKAMLSTHTPMPMPRYPRRMDS